MVGSISDFIDSGLFSSTIKNSILIVLSVVISLLIYKSNNLKIYDSKNFKSYNLLELTFFSVLLSIFIYFMYVYILKYPRLELSFSVLLNSLNNIIYESLILRFALYSTLFYIITKLFKNIGLKNIIILSVFLNIFVGLALTYNLYLSLSWFELVVLSIIYVIESLIYLLIFLRRDLLSSSFMMFLTDLISLVLISFL